MRSIVVVFLTFACIVNPSEPPKAVVAPEVQAALDQIHASSLRNDLSYIASDELEGRDSPSHGLDLAADYIAAQFRRAGLKPAAGDSYFQNASMLAEQANYSNFALKLSSGDHQFSATQKDAVIGFADALDLKDAPVFKLDLGDEALVEHLTASQVDGQVVITEIEPRSLGRFRSANRVLRAANPALVILVDKKGFTVDAGSSVGRASHELVEADEAGPDAAGSPRVTLTGETAARFYGSLKSGAGNATAAVHIAAAHRTPAKLRNVIGVLRGSDPALRDTYVLLTAHYDHLGIKPGATGDRIYNGANDDGSGTVSVMEVARALAGLPKHPRRSIVFMTFFGEEEGLIGSEYYVHHPEFPLEKTVADLNLEQVGRTDSTEGPQISNASPTGFDYSDLTGYLQRAGERTGIKIYKNPIGSDRYFTQGDNLSFAEAGIPAQSLCVAFDFPDYHRVSDEWQKIDYDNMAKVDRAIALAMFLMADSEQPVRWNEDNPKTERYVRAWKQRGVQ